MAALELRRSDVGEAMRTKLAGFVATLRDNGFTVGLAESRDALSLLASPAARRPATLKPAFRALFSADHSDFAAFRRDLRGLLERPARAYAREGLRHAEDVAEPSKPRRQRGAELRESPTPPSSAAGGDGEAPGEGRARREGATQCRGA